MNIEIDIETFVNPKADRRSFDSLFKMAVQEKRAIQFDFSNEKIKIRVLGNSEDFCVVIKPKYIFQKLNLETVSDYGLFLPFLVNFSSITIGSKCFFYYPNHYRSIMNILVRNFSINLLNRFDNLEFIFDKSYTSEKNIFLSEEIAKNIFWEIKNLFKNFSNKKELSLYFFKFGPLVGGNFFDIDILDNFSNKISDIIRLDYEKDYKKKEVRNLFSFRDSIASLKYKSD